MGGLMSKAVKPIKNFNIENRAERVLQSDKPRPSPRHPSTAAAYEKLMHGKYFPIFLVLRVHVQLLY